MLRQLRTPNKKGVSIIAAIVKAIRALLGARETEYERFCRERRARAPRHCLNEAAHKLNN